MHNKRMTYFSLDNEELGEKKIYYIGCEPDYYNMYERIASAIGGTYIGKLSDFPDIHRDRKNTGIDLDDTKENIFLIQTESNFIDLWHYFGTLKDSRGAFVPATHSLQKVGYTVEKKKKDVNNT